MASGTERRIVRLCLVAFAFAASVGPMQAQELDTARPSGRMTPDGFSASMGFGFAEVGGEWSNALDDAIDVDINLTYLFRDGFRLGLGAYYASYHVRPQFGAERVNNVQLQAVLGYSLPLGPWRPYAQIRPAYIRLKLEGFHGAGPPPPTGENPEPRHHGAGGTFVVGFEFAFSTHVTFDANGWYGMFATQPLDLIEINGPEVSSGRTWGARIGVTWYTDP